MLNAKALSLIQPSAKRRIHSIHDKPSSADQQIPRLDNWRPESFIRLVGRGDGGVLSAVSNWYLTSPPTLGPVKAIFLQTASWEVIQYNRRPDSAGSQLRTLPLLPCAFPTCARLHTIHHSSVPRSRSLLHQPTPVLIQYYHRHCGKPVAALRVINAPGARSWTLHRSLSQAQYRVYLLFRIVTSHHIEACRPLSYPTRVVRLA